MLSFNLQLKYCPYFECAILYHSLQIHIYFRIPYNLMSRKLNFNNLQISYWFNINISSKIKLQMRQNVVRVLVYVFIMKKNH